LVGKKFFLLKNILKKKIVFPNQYYVKKKKKKLVLSIRKSSLWVHRNISLSVNNWTFLNQWLLNLWTAQDKQKKNNMNPELQKKKKLLIIYRNVLMNNKTSWKRSKPKRPQGRTKQWILIIKKKKFITMYNALLNEIKKKDKF